MSLPTLKYQNDFEKVSATGVPVIILKKKKNVIVILKMNF